MVGDDGMTMVFAILCVSHRGKDTIMSSVLGSGTAVRHFHRFASKGERSHPSWFHGIGCHHARFLSSGKQEHMHFR
jgi:hypothetical protein